MASLCSAVEDLVNQGTLVGLGDEELLTRFRERHDCRAFAAIVERHGPMVLALCRRFLDDPHDVEDAFQATFLVLLRKGREIRKTGSMAAFLHGVARRVSIRIRRARRPAPLHSDLSSHEVACPAEQREALAIVHTEVDRLPEKYRLPIVLFYLEGLSHEQTAARLRWPVGTVRGRLARARDTLRRRLGRRGLAPTLLAPETLERLAPAPSIPEALLQATALLAAGKAPISPGILAQGVIHTMTVEKLRETLLVIAGVSLALVAGASAVRGSGGPQGKEAPPPALASQQPGGTAQIEARREAAEEALDRKKVEAELQELQLEAQRTRIRALHKSLSSLEDIPVGIPEADRAAMLKSYAEARQRNKEQLEIHTERLMEASVQLGRLKRQIDRESRALGRAADERANGESVERRLRSLEEKVDRLIDAVKPK